MNNLIIHKELAVSLVEVAAAPQRPCPDKEAWQQRSVPGPLIIWSLNLPGDLLHPSTGVERGTSSETGLGGRAAFILPGRWRAALAHSKVCQFGQKAAVVALAFPMEGAKSN